MRFWLAILLVLPATIAFAGNDEIEHHCTTRYPNAWQYFAWKDCVKTETQHELEENLKRERKEQARQREEQARPCLADDLSRMESAAINSNPARTARSASSSCACGYPK
jgi:hypothetical protein